jgi:phosphate transport system protein
MPSPLPRFTATVETLEREALGELQGVVRQLDRSVEAVTGQDERLADQVLRNEEAAEERYRLLQERVLAALASHRGAPDLQMLASLLHVLRGLRRIGGQCASMARLASATTAAAPEPTALSELVEGAAALSVSAVWLARASFASRDVELAHEVARLDAELTRRSRVIARRALELADAGELHEWAMTTLLVGSYSERVSDAAVDIAEQTVVIVNGLFREVAEAEPLPGEPAAAW